MRFAGPFGTGQGSFLFPLINGTTGNAANFRHTVDATAEMEGFLEGCDRVHAENCS